MNILLSDQTCNSQPLAAIFLANRTFARDLAEVVLSLNAQKFKCYIACAHRDAAWDELRGDIPNGVLLDDSGAAIVEDGTPAYGLTVCNAPVGTIPLVRGYLKEHEEKIVTGFDRIAQLLDPGR